MTHDLKWSKLVEQGIEPNPGPFRIKACSLNTGGMESTVKIMDMLSEAACDVSALQETRLTQAGLLSLETNWITLGFESSARPSTSLPSAILKEDVL